MTGNRFIHKIIKIRDRNRDNNTENMIRGIRNNLPEDFLNWLEERKEKYYKMAWAYLHNHYDIEDVFQITTIKVYEKIHQLKEEKFFETWVTAIFLNECKGILRRKKREVFVDRIEEVEDIGKRPKENLTIEFKERLNQLEDIHKEVLILKYLCGYSQEEIAKIQEIPVGTVKSRIYRGLKQLRKEMEKEV